MTPFGQKPPTLPAEEPRQTLQDATESRRTGSIDLGLTPERETRSWGKHERCGARAVGRRLAA